MATLTTFEKIMFQKHMTALDKARKEGDSVEVDRLVKKTAPIVNKMDEQARTEFHAELNNFNMAADKFDEGANIINDTLANLSAVDKDEVDQLMQQEMKNAANKLAQSMPNVPTGRTPQQKQQTTSQATLDRLNSEALKVPTGPLKDVPPKKTAQQPAKKTQYQQQQQQRQAQRDKLRNDHEAKIQKLQQTKQRFEGIAQHAKEQTKPQVQNQAKKDNPLHQYIDKKQKDLTERRKASMVDAKNDIKKAYNTISNFLTKITKAIKKAPEQEIKLNPQDHQIIEQIVSKISKPGVTPVQAIIYTSTILNQIKNPSKPEPGSTQETVAPKQGWLERALNTVKSVLTTISNTLGFKSAKEELQETIKNIDTSTTHEATHEQDKPEISKDNEQEQEPDSPGSGFQ